MKKNNRALSHEVLEDIRIRSVKMVVKSRISNKEVCEIMEIGISSLSLWMKLYREGGWKALKSKKDPGGRPKDPKKNLTEREMQQLEKILLQEPRDIKQLKLDLALWTSALIGEVVRKIFFKKLKEGQIRKILKKLGFTNQKPIFRAYQQDLLKVEAWKKEGLPTIEAEAIREEREILYGDEAGFKSTEHRGRTWGKKGKTPIVRATGARFGINAISAISKNGVLRFMAYEGSFTSDTLLIFLKKLVFKTDKRFTLILDGHPTHKTKKVQDYLELIKYQIRIYYLPPYSPELNPDELVWNHVKNDMKGRFSASVEGLRKNLATCLFRLQKKKTLVIAFFSHPEFA
jgi:transposase